MRKKLVGEAGETLITPSRVSVSSAKRSLLLGHWAELLYCCTVETVEGGGVDKVFTQREADKNVLFGERGKGKGEVGLGRGPFVNYYSVL